MIVKVMLVIFGYLIMGFVTLEILLYLDMAIKALEQETVSRESYDHEYFLRKELELKVAKLEKQIAEQESKTEWIPVSECLPEEKENPITMDFYEYPCTVKFGDVYDVRYYKFGRGKWWHGAGTIDKEVIAWMPLPEPYKAESEGENERDK